MLSVLAFKRSLAEGILDGGSNEVSLGGSRLTRFMKDVESITGSGEVVTTAEERGRSMASASSRPRALPQAKLWCRKPLQKTRRQLAMQPLIHGRRWSGWARSSSAPSWIPARQVIPGSNATRPTAHKASGFRSRLRKSQTGWRTYFPPWPRLCAGGVHDAGTLTPALSRARAACGCSAGALPRSTHAPDRR